VPSFMENYLKDTDFIKIQETLDKSGSIIITTHTNPDGDAIGASLAMFLYLSKRGFIVHVVIPDLYPEFLAWMPGAKEIMIFEQHPLECKQLVKEADLIICVDFNNLKRLNELGDDFRRSDAAKILIDHHLNPSDEFSLKISFNKISSTSELIYDFICESGYKSLIDKHIAECLYTGIATDTGSFSYSCNYVKTYLITAELFRLGIDGEHIHRLIYDTYSESRLRLLGYAVSGGLRVLPEYHALSIRDINLAALFMERDGQVKVSFRSKGSFSVDRLAREHFGGGGHRNASGANCNESLDVTISRFLDLLPSFGEDLIHVYND